MEKRYSEHASCTGTHINEVVSEYQSSKNGRESRLLLHLEACYITMSVHPQSGSSWMAVSEHQNAEKWIMYDTVLTDSWKLWVANRRSFKRHTAAK
jgi:hypothetical protein